MRRRAFIGGSSALVTGGCIGAVSRDCTYSYVSLPDVKDGNTYPDPTEENWREPDQDVVEAFELAYVYNRDYRESYDEFHLSTGRDSVAIEGETVTIQTVTAASYEYRDDELYAHADFAWSVTYFFQGDVLRAEGHARDPPEDVEEATVVVACE